jgi:hypothetical protein
MQISGEGGYGGTHWMGMNVEEMWRALANQDTTTHYKLLAGWRRSYELTFEHMSQVKNYRENLAEAWPPENSAASAAYLARLDLLIQHLQETYETAVTNHSIFATATLALSVSRNNLKPLYDEYVANRAKLAVFAADSRERPVGAGKYVVLPPRPPVAADRQEYLNQQARAIMYGLSSELITANEKIVIPSAYDPSLPSNEHEVENRGYRYTAPAVPAVTPFTPSPTASAAQTLGNGPASHKPSDQDGPILGGAQPGAISPAMPAPPNEHNPANPGGRALPGVIGPILTGPPVIPGVSRAVPSGSASLPALTIPTDSRHGVPIKGIIGAVPRGVPAQQGNTARPVQRVNPVGGIIQPASSPTRAGGAAASGVVNQPLGNINGRPGLQRDETVASPRRAPDTQWEAAKGVPSVILPAPEQQIDPGPAIGLK